MRGLKPECAGPDGRAGVKHSLHEPYRASARDLGLSSAKVTPHLLELLFAYFAAGVAPAKDLQGRLIRAPLSYSIDRPNYQVDDRPPECYEPQ